MLHDVYNLNTKNFELTEKMVVDKKVQSMIHLVVGYVFLNELGMVSSTCSRDGQMMTNTTQ